MRLLPWARFDMVLNVLDVVVHLDAFENLSYVYQAVVAVMFAQRQ